MRYLLACLLLCGLNAAFVRADQPPNALPAEHIVARLGPRETILASGQHGLKYFPDECLVFLQTSPQFRVLMAAGVSSVLLEGPDMKALVSRGTVLKPGPPGSYDNGYAGIAGAVQHPTTGELLAFYHAEDHEGLPAIPGGIPGFYCCVAAAASKDNGASFRKLGPVITASRPKDVKGRADQGCGDLCVVADAENHYLYAYYCDHSRSDNRGVQICAARCALGDAGTTTQWTKYYHGRFDQPGLGGQETPVVSAQTLRGDALFPQVTFVPALRRYVMVFNYLIYWELAPLAKPQHSGIYMASSLDGLRWSTPTQLLSVHSIPFGLGKEIGWHPALFVSTVTNGSAHGWLYYSYSPSWGHRPPHQPHYLVGQPITFSITEN